MKRSGLQKDVLALYRRALRMVKTKPQAAQHKFLLYIRYTFHQNAASISPRNVSAIEHLLRVGGRQIDMYENPGVKDCFVSKDMMDWHEQWRKGSLSNTSV
ncbi:hypothetical protein Agabi119p4_7246 [Agaricus bisporus var. burnettii]|uniref:Complex 1 LYR protein domain-containing protein n=1 Tax=Agaricus bisporus var. burnettii TaxID=192524 RepID=A0A8H7EYQ6_AGABI|nr:hypothetical protein Agabi119p4_7246 [Agaricus bisporus var. burnettii]